MITKLNHISSINTGLYKKPDPSGNAYYLHGRHFDDQGMLKENAVLTKEVWIEGKTEKHLLKDKDLLFIAKGEKNRACIYHEEMGRAVASSLFFIIRIQVDTVLPEYLQWYINSSGNQTNIERLTSGSHIPSIPKKSLQELEIPVPSIQQQLRILEIDKLWKKEQAISKQILKEKEHYYQNMLLQVAKSKTI